MTMPLPILWGASKANSKTSDANLAAPTSTRPRWNPAAEHPAPGPQEEAWLRSAYRQGINPYAFAQGEPIAPFSPNSYSPNSIGAAANDNVPGFSGSSS